MVPQEVSRVKPASTGLRQVTLVTNYQDFADLIGAEPGASNLQTDLALGKTKPGRLERNSDLHLDTEN